MDSAANKQIVLDAYAALNAGDAVGYFSCMSDEVQVTYFGSHRFARTFHGQGDKHRARRSGYPA